MRFTRFLLITLFLYPAILSAIDNYRLTAAIAGGPGVRILWGNDFIKLYHHPNVSGMVTATLRYNFKKVVSIGTGIYYQREGSLYKVPYNAPQISVKYYKSDINMDYVSIPLLVRATAWIPVVQKNKQFFIPLFFETGGFVGFMIKAREVVKSGPASIGNHTMKYPISENIYPSIKHLNTGLILAVGTGIPIKETFVITLEARNTVGLINLASRPVINNGTVQTYSCNFTVGFEYRFLKRVSQKAEPKAPAMF